MLSGGLVVRPAVRRALAIKRAGVPGIGRRLERRAERAVVEVVQLAPIGTP